MFGVLVEAFQIHTLRNHQYSTSPCLWVNETNHYNRFGFDVNYENRVYFDQITFTLNVLQYMCQIFVHDRTRNRYFHCQRLE